MTTYVANARMYSVNPRRQPRVIDDIGWMPLVATTAEQGLEGCSRLGIDRILRAFARICVMTPRPASV